MKILIENPSFYPEAGGVQSYLLNLSKEFIKQGNQVTVLCSNPKNKLKEKQIYQKIKIIRYKQPQIRKLLRWKWILIHEKEICKILEKLKKENFDLIISRNPVFLRINKNFFNNKKLIHISPSVFHFYYKINKNKYDFPNKIRYFFQKKLIEK